MSITSDVKYKITVTGQKLEISLKEVSRKYYRIDPNFIQCAGNLALSYCIYVLQ